MIVGEYSGLSEHIGEESEGGTNLSMLDCICASAVVTNFSKLFCLSSSNSHIFFVSATLANSCCRGELCLLLNQSKLPIE